MTTLLIAPLTPFSPRSNRGLGLAALVSRVLVAPGRWMEARKVRAELASLSEREWSDIGWARAEDEIVAAPSNDQDPAERADRARAIRAWYGHDQRAA